MLPAKLHTPHPNLVSTDSQKLQVNAIACGVIDTSMNDQLTPEERKALEDEIPAGRYGTPKEIAQMVWNIVHAPEYMTGQIIGVDGGFL